MYARKIKGFLIAFLCLMLLPYMAISEYSLSFSYGSMAPTRIREMVRHGENYYAIVDEPQGFWGRQVVHKIKEIDLLTGKEETLYSNASRRIHNLMATDKGLYFLEPNLYHNNNTAYRIDLKTKRKIRVIGQEYSPLALIGSNERGLFAACEGEKGTDIRCFNDDEAKCIVTDAKAVCAVNDGQFQFGVENEKHRMSYELHSDEVSSTPWPEGYKVFYQYGNMAICSIYDEVRELYPIGYTIVDQSNVQWIYRIQPEAFEEYTFVLLEDMILMASKKKDEELFTIQAIDLKTQDCLDKEKLVLTSPLFMIGNQVFYEVETNEERKIVEYTNKRN